MKEIKSLFLGPKAENQELYESLILEIIRDSCFLRKNFHPNDKPIITEFDKLQEDYTETTSELKQHLQTVLSELKKGVPLYHPRYIGHMHGDLLLSAIAGYFGTILYNSNNVVGESSPATTEMEFRYISGLAQMVGYKRMINLGNETTKQPWGHLCSGGTSANIEALWVARNVKYYPISVKLASLSEPNCEFLKDVFLNYFNKYIKELTFNELFNLPSREIFDLKDNIYKQCKIRKSGNTKFKDYVLEIKKSIEKYDVVRTGLHGIHIKVSEKGEILNLPNLYVAKSKHYSWDKAIDVIGIGQDQLIEVNLDNDYRMDFDSFNRLFRKDKPTLAVIGILGSSKQGSIDPIDKLIDFRNNLENNEKISYYLHVDGAYGGYFPCLLRDERNEKQSYNDVLKFLKTIKILDLSEEVELFDNLINENWYKKIEAVQFADSITIDPHKMGYVPYPAGCIVFDDTRCKDFISYTPSYLNDPGDENDISTAFLGQWTLEGSRPGAAATACYLSTQVLPLHQKAHGILIKNSIQAANRFWINIKKFNEDVNLNNGFKIVPTYTPETNIVSYVLAAPDIIKAPKYLNILTKELYKKFSINEDSVIPAQNFMVAKDSFKISNISNKSFIKECGITYLNENEEIIYLSSVFMNPLSIYLKEDFYLEFMVEMVKYANIIFSEILLEIINDKKGERINVLWLEDEDIFKTMKKDLLLNINVGRFLNIDFKTNFTDAKESIKKLYDIYLFDLNLTNKNHKEFIYEDIELTINLIIEEIVSKERLKILFYSKYFSEAKVKHEIMEIFKEKGIVVSENKCIPKTENPQFDIEMINKGIFQIYNQIV